MKNNSRFYFLISLLYILITIFANFIASIIPSSLDFLILNIDLTMQKSAENTIKFRFIQFDDNAQKKVLILALYGTNVANQKVIKKTELLYQ